MQMSLRIDKALQESPQLAPKGKVVPTPKITFTAPETAAAGSRITIKFRSATGVPVRIAGSRASDGDSDILQTEGRIYRRLNQLGTVESPVYMATEDNVVFTQNISLKIVSAEAYEASRSTHPWELPEYTLYFLDEPGTKWETLSPDQREWLKVDPGTLGVIHSEAEKETLLEQSLGEWQRVIQPQWVPDPELVTVRTNFEPPAPPKYAAYSSFAHKDYKVAYMGNIGKNFWLYIEQPAPLSKEVRALRADEVIKPEVLQAINSFNPATNGASVSFMSRSFVRYRSLNYQGPYERVRILLCRIWFSTDETGSFHYPIGNLTPLLPPKENG